MWLYGDISRSQSLALEASAVAAMLSKRLLRAHPWCKSTPCSRPGLTSERCRSDVCQCRMHLCTALRWIVGVNVMCLLAIARCWSYPCSQLALFCHNLLWGCVLWLYCDSCSSLPSIMSFVHRIMQGAGGRAKGEARAGQYPSGKGISVCAGCGRNTGTSSQFEFEPVEC